MDLWVTNIAGFGAIGVAFCPTKPAVCAPGTTVCPASSVTRLSTSQQAVGDIHLFFAAVTFLALGVMALRFAKGGKTPALNDTLTGLRRVLTQCRFESPRGFRRLHLVRGRWSRGTWNELSAGVA